MIPMQPETISEGRSQKKCFYKYEMLPYFWEHLNESSQARNWSFEAGGSLAARQEERARRKEPEEVFLQI
ncbi:hypothetical protein QUA43_13905 [Microcoleus sp. N9_B4]|uniref:hypothetical protein n=1 Tax=Microcoleus sp. N9_B4 TaxID=3055386 RepID=UPI002FD677AB